MRSAVYGFGGPLREWQDKEPRLALTGGPPSSQINELALLMLSAPKVRKSRMSAARQKVPSQPESLIGRSFSTQSSPSIRPFAENGMEIRLQAQHQWFADATRQWLN